MSEDGDTTDIWYVSITLYTTVVAVVTLRIILYTRFWTWINHVAILIFTILLFLIWFWIADNIKFFQVYKTAYMLATTWHGYLTVLVCLWLIYCIEMIFISFGSRTWADRYRLDPEEYHQPLPDDEYYYETMPEDPAATQEIYIPPPTPESSSESEDDILEPVEPKADNRRRYSNFVGVVEKQAEAVDVEKKQEGAEVNTSEDE